MDPRDGTSCGMGEAPPRHGAAQRNAAWTRRPPTSGPGQLDRNISPRIQLERYVFFCVSRVVHHKSVHEYMCVCVCVYMSV